MANDSVLLDVRDGVAHVTLNRPGNMNLINPESLAALHHAVTSCADDPRVRVVLLSAAGKHFSGGGDLQYFTSLGDGVGAGVRELATNFHTIVSRMVRLEVPVVAAVQGAVAGGGLSLAMAADLVVAAETAKLTVAYSNIAFSVDGGLSYSLPRLVGLRRALDLALTNRVLSAEEARDIGMVSEVVPDAELAERSQALAAKLASGPKLAQARIKELMRRSLNETLETQLEYETRGMAETTGSPDGIEGVAAFLAKRPPKFA
jgi:2-(1,2-epoxy-1,2-dihydrophenyl)acetyl-CoA isomerase